MNRASRQIYFCVLTVMGLVATLILSPAATASVIVYTGGLVDGFSGGTDPAFPSPELDNLLTASYGGTVPFDFISHDTQVAHTFTGLPNNITGGTLEFRVRGGPNPGVDTDGLAISFVDTATTNYLDAVVFARPYGDLTAVGSLFPNLDPGFVTPGAVWGSTSDLVVSLDISALPLNPNTGGGTLNLIPLLNSNGYVDINFSDDSEVDYVRLTLNTPSIPEPTTFALTGIGLTVLVLSRRKRSSH